ncbi:2-nitropropane dioxygenase, partial [Singulisphaera rosea]
MLVPTTFEETLERALCRVRDPFLIVERGGGHALQEWDSTAWGDPAEADRVVGVLPACRPENLGDTSFCAEH